MSSTCPIRLSRSNRQHSRSVMRITTMADITMPTATAMVHAVTIITIILATTSNWSSIKEKLLTDFCLVLCDETFLFMRFFFHWGLGRDLHSHRVYTQTKLHELMTTLHGYFFSFLLPLSLFYTEGRTIAFCHYCYHFRCYCGSRISHRSANHCVG